MVDQGALMSESMSLHDLLLRDWGMNLPITGGWGRSPDDPIVITTDDPGAIVMAQLHTLRGLGRGRGVFWRTMGLRWENEARAIQQFKIETRELTATEIISQVENYYFDVSSLLLAGSKPLGPSLIVFRDDSGLLFPYEIGWLHHDTLVNNEPHKVGAGVTIHFKAPQTIASVYVYGIGQINSRDIRHPRILEEFENASADLMRVNPHFTPWPDREMADRLVRYYRVGEGREASLLALAAGQDRFVKVRATWLRDEFIDSVAGTFLDKVIAIAAGAQSETG